jgi:hypothetical protein
MPQQTTANRRLARLAGNHKWYVGGGRRILWAPEFPLFLDLPGFWDPGTYLEIKLGTLFTYALLENGRALTWKARGRQWRPDGLTTTFGAGGLTITELKSVTPDDAFRSALTFRNASARVRTLELVLWGRVEATDTGDVRFEGIKAGASGVSGDYKLHDEARHARHDLRLSWTLNAAGGRGSAFTSYAVQNSEDGAATPDWQMSPFYELFNGRLPNTCYPAGGIEHRPGAQPHRKLTFVALHRRLRIGPRGTARVVGACQVTSTSAAPMGRPALSGWEQFFAAAPEFHCSDPYIEKYFDYRWYGLRLNAIDLGRPPLRHPCVFEGINPGWFRHAISYSSQVLPRDLRWLHDPRLAQGCILNFLECQRADGFIHGALLTEQKERDWHAGTMYHADWGGAARAVYQIHPEQEFLKACYAGLTRYADWFDRERDADHTGLYDVLNQAETGQEYMSRYLFVDPRADEWGPFRLKGVDATVYTYSLKQSLAWMATELGRAGEAEKWHAGADAIAGAVRSKMWDPRLRKFCDVDPRNGARSPVKCLTDFYPFTTDLATREHLPAIYDHLLNPREFWTEWPAPSTSLDDEKADAYGRWLGKRHLCPWNGRTWLMTNGHIAEALANAARTLDPQLEAYAVTFLTRFIHMLFVDHDLGRPTSYEYYNPLTGQAPFFRGTDDYMHCTLIDLIIRHVAGLQPQADGTIVVEPLQFGLRRFALDNCVVAGRPVRVQWDGQQLVAHLGRKRAARKGWGRLVLEP